MLAIRSILTFFISTVAFFFLILANLSGAPAPFVRNLYFSKIQDEWGQYIWTLYDYCSFSGNEVTGSGSCSARYAAYPYEPYTFSSGFNHEAVYKNGSKAAYAFILMSLPLCFIANVAALVAFFKLSPKIFAVFKWVTLASALLIFTGSVINSALHRLGSKRIESDGVYTSAMGVTMFAFIWLATVLQFASFCVAHFWKGGAAKPDTVRNEEELYEYDTKNPFAGGYQREGI